MGIEYSPKGKKKQAQRRKRANHMPKAGPVTVRRADGSVEVRQALVGSVEQVKKA